MNERSRRAKRLRRAAMVAAPVAFVLAVLPTTAMPAAWMSDGELRATFGGAEFTGVYRDGVPFTELYRSNGRLAYRELGDTRDGNWSVVSGTFCTIYDQAPTGGCFRIAKVSANCFEAYFATRTEAEARERQRDPVAWTARLWRSDRPSTCNEVPAV